MTAAVPSRRERLRAQTLAEIRTHAYEQLSEGGAQAVSLNGIAKAMGMSGPALYRYFASRDELLATLVADSYEALADTLADAAESARRRSPEGRMRAVADAYRGWALEHPQRYRLVFGSRYGSGELDREQIIPAAQRAMSTLLGALAAAAPAPPAVDDPLARQLTAWAESRSDGPVPEPGVLLLGVLAWTRLHGIVSLEIEGVFAEMGLDGARLCGAELDQLLG
jgi:AcrR family transcriptional regulator